MKLRTDPARFCTLLFATVAAFAALPFTASGQYATSFEPPVYVSGEINGQDTWTVNRTTPTARIRTATELESDLTALGMNPGTTVHSGSQAFLMSGVGLNNSAVRTISGFQTEQIVTLEYWARPLIGGSLGNIFLVMEDSTGANPGSRAAAVRFGPTTIDYFSAGAWQPTSTIWDEDLWYRLTLTADYLNKTYDFSIDGTQVAATVPFYSATAADFSQVRIFRGENQAGMIVDDLLVVPEPATIACLLGGVAILLHRRRRR